MAQRRARRGQRLARLEQPNSQGALEAQGGRPHLEPLKAELVAGAQPDPSALAALVALSLARAPAPAGLEVAARMLAVQPLAAWRRVQRLAARAAREHQEPDKDWAVRLRRSRLPGRSAAVVVVRVPIMSPALEMARRAAAISPWTPRLMGLVAAVAGPRRRQHCSQAMEVLVGPMAAAAAGLRPMRPQQERQGPAAMGSSSSSTTSSPPTRD